MIEQDEAGRLRVPIPGAMILIAVLATGMTTFSVSGQETQIGPQRPSAVIAQPREFDWIAKTGDPRIRPILEQAFDLEDQKDYVAAIEKYKQLLKLGTLGKGAAPTFNAIAGCYQRLGNFAEEVNWAKRAAAASPEFALAYINLGNGYAGVGDLGRASQAFTQYVALEPKNPMGYYSLGVVADEQQDWSKAESLYKKSIAVNPNFATGHYNLAAAYANQQKFPPAIEELQKVIALDPADEDARAMLKEIKGGQ